jgi:hypothetical protein
MVQPCLQVQPASSPPSCFDSLDATAQNLFSPEFNQSIFHQAGHRLHSTSATVATPYFASPPSLASLSQHLPGPRHPHTSPSYSAKSVVSLHLAHLRQRQSMSRACSLRKGDLQIQPVEERQLNRLRWRDRRRPAGVGREGLRQQKSGPVVEGDNFPGDHVGSHKPT